MGQLVVILVSDFSRNSWVTCVLLHQLQLFWRDGRRLGHEVDAVVLDEERLSAVVLDGCVLVQPDDVVVHWWRHRAERLLEITRLFSRFQFCCFNPNKKKNLKYNYQHRM